MANAALWGGGISSLIEGTSTMQGLSMASSARAGGLLQEGVGFAGMTSLAGGVAQTQAYTTVAQATAGQVIEERYGKYGGMVLGRGSGKSQAFRMIQDEESAELVDKNYEGGIAQAAHDSAKYSAIQTMKGAYLGQNLKGREKETAKALADDEFVRSIEPSATVGRQFKDLSTEEKIVRGQLIGTKNLAKLQEELTNIGEFTATTLKTSLDNILKGVTKFTDDIVKFIAGEMGKYQALGFSFAAHPGGGIIVNAPGVGSFHVSPDMKVTPYAPGLASSVSVATLTSGEVDKSYSIAEKGSRAQEASTTKEALKGKSYKNEKFFSEGGKKGNPLDESVVVLLANLLESGRNLTVSGQLDLLFGGGVGGGAGGSGFRFGANYRRSSSLSDNLGYRDMMNRLLQMVYKKSLDTWLQSGTNQALSNNISVSNKNTYQKKYQLVRQGTEESKGIESSKFNVNTTYNSNLVVMQGLLDNYLNTAFAEKEKQLGRPLTHSEKFSTILATLAQFSLDMRGEKGFEIARIAENLSPEDLTKGSSHIVEKVKEELEKIKNATGMEIKATEKAIPEVVSLINRLERELQAKKLPTLNVSDEYK
jgi:hypothetical protein